MKRYLLAIVMCAGLYASLSSVSVHAADNLQMRPLVYREALEAGQQKRGVVDLANGSTETAEVVLTVRFFRQVGDDGELTFYDNADEAAAITLDVSDVELKAKEAIRIGFTVDGAKLPQGDVFAVVFATTKHPGKPQTIVPAVQVGTLLILENGRPGPRAARIAGLSVAPLQIGDAVQGTVGVANPANVEQASGFFPKMKIEMSPWGRSTQFEGPLVYAGRTRTFDFSVPSSQFGIFKVTVRANGASESRYVFLMTGTWRIIVPLVLALTLAAGILFWWLRRRGKLRKKLHPKG